MPSAVARSAHIVIVQIQGGVLDERPECAHKKTAYHGGCKDGRSQSYAGHDPE